MVLSDDGSLLVTGSDDRTVRMWSTLSDPTECLGVLEGHDGLYFTDLWSLCFGEKILEEHEIYSNFSNKKNVNTFRNFF